MKICTLNPHQLRVFKRDAGVLVYTDTDEAVMVDGNPRTITPAEVLELFKCIKRKKLFSVDVEGRACHFVRGRHFLAREFAKAHKAAVQLRAPTGRVLMNYRPKNGMQDILKTPCKPIEVLRGIEPAVRDLPPNAAVIPNTQVIIPEPKDCPDCSHYTKPIGCREDEHHFVCKWHDDYEKARERRLAIAAARRQLADGKTVAAPPVFDAEAPTEPPPAPAEPAMVIDLETGAALRSATPEEVLEAEEASAATGFPCIERGGVRYGIATENLAPVGG